MGGVVIAHRHHWYDAEDVDVETISGAVLHALRQTCRCGARRLRPREARP